MTWPDVEGAMRDYLRADAGVSALVSTRVFFGIPRNGARFPLAVVRKVAGRQDGSEAPLDVATIQVDAWGTTKANAATLRSAVRDACDALREPTTQGTVVLYGANCVGDTWVPDPESDQPRYAMTFEVVARAA